jgi:hypothetical protein
VADHQMIGKIGRVTGSAHDGGGALKPSPGETTEA